MKNKLLILASIVQIILLVNFCIAQSYGISEDKQTIVNVEDFLRKTFGKSSRILISFLSIEQIGFVSATVDANCCIKTEDTLEICKDITSEDGTDVCLDSNRIDSSCQDSNDCKTGCCFDSTQGTCSSAPNYKCEEDGGTWTDTSSCATESNCIRGCCVIGRRFEFTTDARCEILKAAEGITEDVFREELTTEPACLNLDFSDDDGACLFEDNTCRRMLETACETAEGTHYQGKLCSHADLVAQYTDTSYVKQAYVGCSISEGLDEIYWFDSWGNRENIYNSDKDISWNDGLILSKGASCELDLSDTNSIETCGNCNRFVSSVCSQDIDDLEIKETGFVCQDLGCDENRDETNDRKNGEQWCIYDSAIGNGIDTAGSTHWLATCTQGEITYENGGDYREKICGETVITDVGEDFIIASLELNNADLCLSYNPAYLESEGKSEREIKAAQMEDNCNADKQCYVNNVDVGPNFKFGICVPKYPKGYDFNAIQEVITSSTRCSVASITCPVYYERQITQKSGNCIPLLGCSNTRINIEDVCVHNCRCRDPEFAQQMNNLCISLGDCGNYINYEGDGTDNTAFKGDRHPSIIGFEEYVGNKDYNDGTISLIGEDDETAISSSKEYFNKDYKFENGEWVYDGQHPNEEFSNLQNVAGAMGTGMLLDSLFVWGYGTAPFHPAWWGGYSGVASAAGAAVAGAVIGNEIAKHYGIQGNYATMLVVASGTTGALLTTTLTTTTTGGATALTASGWGAIIAVGIVVFIAATELGKVTVEKIEFTCNPWTPPVGSEDSCKKCNENPLKPCTRYRCEALGNSCHIINYGLVENPECIYIPPKDSTAPDIWATNNITEGYEFTEEKESSVNLIKTSTDASDLQANCIEIYTDVEFKLETDEYAQCGYSFSEDDSVGFDEMTLSQEGSIYSLNHTLLLNFASIDAIVATSDLEGSLVTERYGDVNMKIKCKDRNAGVINTNSYIVNFCIRGGIDKSAVSAKSITPISESILIFGGTTKDITLWIDKPATCKYDYADKTYEEMANQMTCYDWETNGIHSTDLRGYDCDATLTGLTGPENITYFRCKNNPWNVNEITGEDLIDEETEETMRFTNAQDLFVGDEFILKSSVSKLGVTPVSPTGVNEVGDGDDDYEMELKVITSGGGEGGGEGDGFATCSYDLEGDEGWIDFYVTGEDTHTQTLNFEEDTFDIPIKCVDVAGNGAETKIEFELLIDDVDPVIATIYKLGGNLVITTYEASNCFYNDTIGADCSFDGNSDNNMESSLANLETIHDEVSWDTDKTYKIWCTDEFGLDSGCKTIAPSAF